MPEISPLYHGTDYKNHIRWYPPHHFIFYPLILLFIAGSVFGYMHKIDIPALWIGIIILLVLIGALSFMMRQHYALVCQNRIVRLELRLRYFILSGKRLEEVENVYPLNNFLHSGLLPMINFAVT